MQNNNVASIIDFNLIIVGSSLRQNMGQGNSTERGKASHELINTHTRIKVFIAGMSFREQWNRMKQNFRCAYPNLQSEEYSDPIQSPLYPQLYSAGTNLISINYDPRARRRNYVIDNANWLLTTYYREDANLN